LLEVVPFFHQVVGEAVGEVRVMEMEEMELVVVVVFQVVEAVLPVVLVKMEIKHQILQEVLEELEIDQLMVEMEVLGALV
jgi:phospholipid N-methyltransferase